MPLANALYDTAAESLNCERYPLAIQKFTESGLVSLAHAVSPDLLFKNYPYRSGVSKTFRKHCQELAESINELRPENVMDVGGNDGTLLRYVNAKNKVVVDPYVKLSEEALLAGVDCDVEYFGIEYAVKNRENSQNVIFTTNCFQHILDMNGFVEAIRFLLKPFGFWVLEFPDFDLTGTKHYDQIYHEHIYYLSLMPMLKLLKNYGFTCIETKHYDIHNGTRSMTIVPGEYTNVPKFTGAQKIHNEKISDIILRQNKIIKSIQKTQPKIAIYGAAAKGCVTLNALGLTNKDIMYCVDDTPEKQGKYIAGTGIQILPSSEMQKSKPDIMIIQAHNFFDEIERKIPPNVMTIKLY